MASWYTPLPARCGEGADQLIGIGRAPARHGIPAGAGVPGAVAARRHVVEDARALFRAGQAIEQRVGPTQRAVRVGAVVLRGQRPEGGPAWGAKACASRHDPLPLEVDEHARGRIGVKRDVRLTAVVAGELPRPLLPVRATEVA